MVIFITLPISVGMIVLRFPLIRVLFEHGEFTSADTLATAIPLFYFAVGVSAQSVIQILPRMFYALQDTWTPVIIGIISMLANVAFMFMLVKPLQTGGLAFATSLAAVLNMILLLYLLRKRLKSIDGWRILKTSLKTLLASGVMGVVVWFGGQWLTSLVGVDKLASVFVLIVGTLLGAIIFAIITKIMGMEEFEQTMGLVQKRVKRG